MHAVSYAGHDGLKLAGVVGGEASAQPIVLLHGGGQTRHAWDRSARILVERGYRVIAYDARGHGRSEWAGNGDYRLDALIGDLRGIIDTLDVPPVLIGASLGGLTSLLTVGEAAPRTIARALVLVDIVPQVKADGAARIQSFMAAHPGGFADLEEAASAVAAYLPHRPKPRDPSGLRKNLRRGDDNRLYWHWDPQLIAYSGRVNVKTTKERLERAALAVRVPTLVLRGEHSELVSPEGVDALLALIPGSRSAHVSGARHMVAGDENSAFNDEIVAFLDALQMR